MENRHAQLGNSYEEAPGRPPDGHGSRRGESSTTNVMIDSEVDDSGRPPDKRGCRLDESYTASGMKGNELDGEVHVQMGSSYDEVSGRPPDGSAANADTGKQRKR